MQELIKITAGIQGMQVVSARELHEFLQVQTDFTDWCKRMFEYGFTENQDFNLLNFEEVRKEGKRNVKRIVTDYALTLDTAKEIAMLQRSERGKQARQYFIECEKKLKASALPPPAPQPRELVMANAVMLAQQIISDQKEEIAQLRQQAQYAEEVLQAKNCRTVTEIAARFGMSPQKLYQLLNEKGVLYKDKGKMWLPYQKYKGKGLLAMRTKAFHHKSGEVFSISYPVFTEKGAMFITELLGLGREQINALYEPSPSPSATWVSDFSE